MPWTPKQHRLFEAAAHDSSVAKRVGIPQHSAARMAHEGIKRMAAGGNVSIYGGGERIRAPEPVIMGGSGNKHIRVGSPFRPRWGAKPTAFAKGGTVEISDASPIQRIIENADQVTRSYHPDFAAGTRFPGPANTFDNAQYQAIPTAPMAPGTHAVAIPNMPMRGKFPIPMKYMADGGAVDALASDMNIPSGPITSDTTSALNNGVGSWRDVPNMGAQALLGAIQHGAGAGGDIEKTLFPKEPNILPTSEQVGRFLPGTSGDDQSWRDFGGRLPVTPGALLKGLAGVKGLAAVSPLVATKGLEVAPASIEDFRQALAAVRDRAAKAAPAIENNASGESAASLEAINRNAGEDAQKIKRYMVDKNTGQYTPVNMVDRADRIPGPDQVHVVMRPDGTSMVWSQGNNVHPNEVQGIIARLRESMRPKGEL